VEVKVNNLTGDVRKDKDAVEVALNEFRKKIKKSGIMNELRRREFYMSPSKKKRFRKNEALKRRKRDERKAEWTKKQQNEW
jgi:small subunit ribosomal protein S21